MLSVTRGCQPRKVLRETGTTYSCSSETSPVRAENPRNGTSGNETFFNVKHGVQLSPSSCRRQGPSSIFRMSGLTSFIVNLDLIIVTVSQEYWIRGGKAYIKKPVSEIGNLEFGCDARSPEESLEKTSRRLCGQNDKRRTEQEPMALASPSLARSYEVFPSPSMATMRGNEYAWRAFEYLWGGVKWEGWGHLEGDTYVSRNRPRPSKLSVSRSTQRTVEMQPRWSYPCFRIRAQALTALLSTRSPCRHRTSGSVNQKPNSG